MPESINLNHNGDNLVPAKESSDPSALPKLDELLKLLQPQANTSQVGTAPKNQQKAPNNLDGAELISRLTQLVREL